MNQSPNLINWLLTNQMGSAQNMGMPTMPQMQDASKRRQECVSTEKRSDSKTLCNELASEMP